MKIHHSLLLALATPVAHAAVLLDFDNTNTGSARADFTGWIGNSFTVGASDIQITHLGAQDVIAQTGDSSQTSQTVPNNAGSDGFVGDGSIDVRIWNSAGTVVLASVTVTNAGSTADGDGYRYMTLSTPITLTAGQTYLIGAFIGGGEEWFLDDHPASAFTAGSGAITLNSSNFDGATAGILTDIGGTGIINGRWGAANAQFNVVPEPTAALLGGLGVLALLRRRRH